MKYLISTFGWLLSFVSISLIFYSLYILVDYFYFINTALETHGKIIAIETHETKTGTLPGVVNKHQAVRGDIGGFKKINVSLCTMEYLDNNGEIQTGHLNIPRSFNVGDTIKFSYQPDNPKLLRSPENEQPYLIAFLTFLCSIFSLNSSFDLLGYSRRK